MYFSWDDLTEEAKEKVCDVLGRDFLPENFEAVSLATVETEGINSIAGEWEHIVKLIPILKDMGYADMHLYYEDCDIWCLVWHNRELDGKEWVITDGYH